MLSATKLDIVEVGPIIWLPPTQTLDSNVAFTATPSIFTALHIFVPDISILRWTREQGRFTKLKFGYLANRLKSLTDPLCT